VLADAACRQLWCTFYQHFYTDPLFADCRARRLKALKVQDSNDPLAILSSRQQLATKKFRDAAFEPATRKNAKSAWKWWVMFMDDNDGDCYIKPDDKRLPIYLAGFKASLADKLYGDVDSAGTATTYAAQVQWCLHQYHQDNLLTEVSRGIDKQLQDGKRYQGSIDITFFAELYERYANCNDIIKIRNLLVFSFLGLGIQRSQSAVVQSVSELEQKTLLLEDTRLCSDSYAVWWGLKFSKGDPFGRRKGKDRKDWTPTAGYKGDKHPIDIVRLYVHYCKLMGFTLKRTGSKFRQQRKQPFFQQVNRNRPTGVPLTYRELLKDLKQTIRTEFPDLDTHETIERVLALKS